MNEDNDDPYEGTARWLVEAAGRSSPPQPLPATSDSLLHFLEEQTGRSLRTREAIAQFVSELATHEEVQARSARRHQLIRDSALLAMLAVAVLQFYFADVYLQIGRLNKITTFLPAYHAKHPDQTPRASPAPGQV